MQLFIDQLPFMTTTTTASWYMIHTKKLLEKKVTKILEKKKIPNYCPMIRIIQKQSGYQQPAIINRPLLPCIVFVQADPDSLEELKKINGVLSIVHRINNPAIISGEEVMEIRKFLAHYDNVLPEKIPLSFSHSLYAAESPSIEQEGVDHFVILRLPSLGYQLKAVITHKPVVVQIPAVVEDYVPMALAAN
jgi:transcription antitermination factor NusG